MKKRLSFLKLIVLVTMFGFFGANSFACIKTSLLEDPPVIIITIPNTPQPIPIPTINIP